MGERVRGGFVTSLLTDSERRLCFLEEEANLILTIVVSGLEREDDIFLGFW